MNAQIEGVTQLSLCHIGHCGFRSHCLFPFVKGKFLPSWLRHTTTPCANPKSISVPTKGFILSFEFPLAVDPDSNLHTGWGLQAGMAQTGLKSAQKTLQELI